MPGTENERKPDPAFVAAWNASKKPYRTLQELEAELADTKHSLEQRNKEWGQAITWAERNEKELAAAQAEVKKLKDELAGLRASLGATNATDMTFRGGKEPTL